MSVRGAKTYAAGVSARVRQADPAFDLHDLGFESFKAFLQAAAADGFVEASRPPGASDILVALPSGESGQPQPATFDASRYLLPEVWRTLTSSRTEARHWDRAKGRLGEDIVDTPSSSTVPLNPIPASKVVDWMRTFTAALSDTETTRALADSLTSPSPIESFKSVLRSHQGLARKWGKYYRQHVTRYAFEWADSHGIPRVEVVDSSRLSAPQAQSSLVQPDPNQSASAHPAPAASLGATSEYEALVRSRIAEAVNEMPLVDLLRLPIPAQYLIRE